MHLLIRSRFADTLSSPMQMDLIPSAAYIGEETVPVGLALSGGGAKGSFQIGALLYLYREGFFAEIISGSSVGAINAAKLAEGGNKAAQNAAFNDLKAIWDSLQIEDDMFLKANFVRKLEDIARDPRWDKILIIINRDRSNLITPDLAGMIGDVGSIASDAAYIMSNAAKIINTLTDLKDIVPEVEQAEFLFNLEPIANRLRGGSLDPARVAASGIRLRLAAVSLESGDLRYIGEDGSVLQRDAITAYSEPQCNAQRDALRQARRDSEVVYQSALRSNLQAGIRYQEAILLAREEVREQGFPDRITKLEQQLAVCLSGPGTPLRVPLVDGVLASAGIPVVFPLVVLGSQHYGDGGVREVFPIDACIRLNATHVVAISASPLGLKDLPWTYPQVWPMPSIADRGASILMDEAISGDTPANPAVLMVSPRFEVHGMKQIDPGLIRISMHYGFMCAADAASRWRISNNRNPINGNVDGINIPLPPTQQQTAIAKIEEAGRTADVITRIRMAIWSIENSFFAAAPDANRLSLIRALKGMVLHLIDARATLGAGMPSAPELDEWTSAWELHNYALSQHPWAPLAGLPSVTPAPVRRVRGDRSGAVFELNRAFRQLYTGPNDPTIPTVPEEIVDLFVSGNAPVFAPPIILGPPRGGRGRAGTPFPRQ